MNDPFYEVIGKCDRCIIDYCLIEDDVPHQGKRSHKDAILFAMLKVMERDIDDWCREAQDETFPWNLDTISKDAHQPNNLIIPTTGLDKQPEKL